MTVDIRFARVYWVRGAASETGLRGFVVKDPPTSGWGFALVIPGEKSTTLLCPNSLLSYRVPNNCQEVMNAKKVVDWDRDAMAKRVYDAWLYWADLGFNRDFDVAAVVLTTLGHPVPALVPKEVAEGEEVKTSGGKIVNPEKLRPVRKGSKRGLVAEFFLGEAFQPLREAMARLDLTRSGVLSHLFCLNRDHGLGYELANDCARLIVPEGFDVFAEIEPKQAEPNAEAAADGSEGTVSEPKSRGKGKPIDAERLKAIPAPSKRAAIAEHFQDWGDIESMMTKGDLTRSAVLSMLHQIWKDHGLGYEMSPDSSKARLLVPEGFELFTTKQPRAKKAA